MDFQERIMDTIYQYGLTKSEYFMHMELFDYGQYVDFVGESNIDKKNAIFEDIMLQIERDQFDFINEIEHEYLIEQIEQDMFEF